MPALGIGSRIVGRSVAGDLISAETGAADHPGSAIDDLPRTAAATDTPHQPGKTLLWFLRYGGRDEIARAAGRFLAANPGARLGDDDLGAWLDTAGVPDPDLVILAGGPLEARDALLWQGSYAEIWHTALPWPEFTPGDLRAAVGDFAARQRRFGR
jgi:undecaprenyl diphosphate synthase